MKKNAKKQLLMMLLGTALAGVSGSVMAQAPPKKPEPQKVAKMQTDKMEKDLKLTPEQKSKVEDINLKYAKRMDQKMEEIGNPMEKVHEAMSENMKLQDEELKKVLSKEQWARFVETREKHMKEMQGF